MGIGTLQERTLHAMLKRHLEPDESCHEITVGSYVADVKRGEEIIEIQTRAFEKLKPKLRAFLEMHTVTVVHPIAQIKWLTWMDPQSGELSKKRRSPKVGTEHELFCELWKIKEFLSHPNFRLTLIFLELEEYRMKNGWSADGKKGSTRIERIPLDIIRTVDLNTIEDYADLLLPPLPTPFTVTDYQKARHCTNRSASRALYVLREIGAIERVGKQGKAYLYQKKDS